MPPTTFVWELPIKTVENMSTGVSLSSFRVMTRVFSPSRPMFCATPQTVSGDADMRTMSQARCR